MIINKMDTRKLTVILRATLEPNQRQQAEEQLTQIQKIIGFAPALLQIVMMNDLDTPVRQAGVVYLKNLIIQDWQDKESAEGEPMPFTIHEQDRAMIRDSIVDAIIQAPDIVRTQLCVCLNNIIKNDFPNRWTQVVDKIHIYLQNPDANSWMGALLCLYQLTKHYEYHTAEKRVPLLEAMNLLLPMLNNLMATLLPDDSEQAALVKKQILKCFYSLTKYILPLQLLTNETFAQWMEIFRQIVNKPIPEHLQELYEDDSYDLPWWKCKKWAIHTLYRIFERYGSPSNVRTDYQEFAEWYLTTFTGGILETLLKILDQYRNKVYVAPRVLQLTLCYIDQCVSHGHSWKLLKPHMNAIIQDVLFPLMSHSKFDEELWDSDPQEYIRLKFDIFEDFVSPVTAGQSLLTACCKKRKDMLQRTMQLCMQVLVNSTGEYGPREKDGALHMVGTLSDMLLKKKIYKDQLESLITIYVYPEFSSNLGYLRARACWMLNDFARMRFRSNETLMEAVRLTVNALLTDTELPVKVEASIALQMLLSSQDRVHKYLEPQINAVTMELLKVIRDTENDNIASVLAKIVPLYTPQLMPIAQHICEHLANTFSSVLETDSGTDEKAITAMGLLNTIETVVNVMEDNPEIMAQLEKTVLQVVGHILQNGIMEYYEEAMSLLEILTSKTISEDMWKVLELLYKIFEKDSIDYFTDMMPVLHNYITVDTNAFLSNENHILAMFNMAKAVLTLDAEDDSEVCAAKLLEVMVLQCKDKIDNCLPSFVELVLNRLTRKVKTAELRTMLLQVLIAILYCNAQLLFSIINKLQESVPTASITGHFIKQWIFDTDFFMGLHNRKMCILGLCALLDMGPSRPNIDEVLPKILPSCLMLFTGLKRAYELRAEDEEESSSSGEDNSEDDEVLSSDEDEIEEMNDEYLKNLSMQFGRNGKRQGLQVDTKITDDFDDDDDDDEDYENGDPVVECYGTPLDLKDCEIDEYVIFKETLQRLSNTEPATYHALTSVLNDQQQKALQAVLVLADQRKAQLDSKRIEQSGGYSFTVPASVPTTFKFS